MFDCFRGAFLSSLLHSTLDVYLFFFLDQALEKLDTFFFSKHQNTCTATTSHIHSSALRAADGFGFSPLGCPCLHRQSKLDGFLVVCVFLFLFTPCFFISPVFFCPFFFFFFFFLRVSSWLFSSSSSFIPFPPFGISLCSCVPVVLPDKTFSFPLACLPTDTSGNSLNCILFFLVFKENEYRTGTTVFNIFLGAVWLLDIRWVRISYCQSSHLSC